MVPPYIGLLSLREDKTRPDGIIEMNVSIEFDSLFVELENICVAVNTILYKPYESVCGCNTSSA
jgi:hypothetical protein